MMPAYQLVVVNGVCIATKFDRPSKALD